MRKYNYFLLLGILTIGCQKDTSFPEQMIEKKQDVSIVNRNLRIESVFAKGADISWLPQMEAKGFKFVDTDGKTKDCIDILKGKGINSVRLRTFVNPSSDPSSGHCSDKECASLAKRCKSKGLRVMINLHFGDTWNSVGVQNPPAAWKGKSYLQTKQLISDYVFKTMNIIKLEGVTPEWVQIGNEINSGICRPVGSVTNGAQMTGLLNASYDMIKKVFPACKVIIHVAQPQGTSAQNLLDVYKANGGKWDITGCSSYASKKNQPIVQEKVIKLKTRFGKPVMMVEVGGPVTKPSETKTVIKQWIAGGGEGVFYWEPENYAPFTSYKLSAWDPNTKKPTIAMDAFLE